MRLSWWWRRRREEKGQMRGLKVGPATKSHSSKADQEDNNCYFKIAERQGNRKTIIPWIKRAFLCVMPYVTFTLFIFILFRSELVCPKPAVRRRSLIEHSCADESGLR